MTYKTPSIRLTLDKTLFNQLISILDHNIKLQIERDNFSKDAEKLKEKLLTYSVPRVNDDETEFVDVRFYPNESSNMIWQLLVRCDNIDIVDDYYSMLINNRENKK